jgi:RNA polymerase sigma-70 factor (ECF subfamily)
MRPALNPDDSVTSSAHKPTGSKSASSSEGWGDEASFRRIAEAHRREIQLHCYRLVGSLQDAEDLTQETLLRAWQGITRLESRTSVRNWLYRIATNVCLTAISKRTIPRRVLPESVAAPTRRMPRGSPADDVPWIEPYPDSELEGSADSSANPRFRYEMREAVRLAFIAVTQRLPARQRAVLLLRDVLGWSADETAQALEMTVASANSALQRARCTLGKTLSREEIANQAPGENRHRDVAERYARAWEKGDLEGLTALLAKDAAMNMPPWKEWYKGRARIRAFFAYAFDWAWRSPVSSFRMVPTRANAEVALGTYVRRPGESKYHPHALQVLTVNGGHIVRLTLFVGSPFFSAFGLPSELGSRAKGTPRGARAPLKAK